MAERIGPLIEEFVSRGMFQTWLRHRPEGWRLASGLWSPFYLQLRHLPSHPDLLRVIGRDLGARLLERLPGTTRIIGIAMAGIPIATSMALSTGIPFGFTRKLEGAKGIEDLQRLVTAYGGHHLVEAEFRQGDRVAVVDDLLTGFTSKELAIGQICREAGHRGVGISVEGLAVVVLRGSQGVAKAAAAGLTLVSLVELTPEKIRQLPGLAPREAEVIAEYLRDPLPFQERSAQASLRREAQRV